MAIWYLWAKNNDPATNEYLAKVIGEQNPECEHRDTLCADDKQRNLWECSAGYGNVKTVITAISKFNLKLEVFMRTERGKHTEAITQFNLWKAESRRAVRMSNQARKIHHRGYHP